MFSASRSWLLSVVVLAIAIAGWQFASAQQGPARGENGRYQMEVDGNAVHVMDTQTGQVWRQTANGTWQQFLSIPGNR